MTAHLQILEAVQRLCAERDSWVFTPDEVVRALPHLNASTVRTHVVSRCCVNTPQHHRSRLDYFRQVSRGRYELMPKYRLRSMPAKAPKRQTPGTSPVQRDTIHAVISKDGETYVVDCHEVAVSTQGKTLDEALMNLTEAVALHLEGEDLSTLGFRGLRRIQVTYELPANVSAA